MPAEGWKDVLKRTWAGVKRDNVQLLAAGLAFFALLALIPALAATVSIYGMFASPSDVQALVSDVAGALPEEAQQLIESQLDRIVDTSSTGLGFTAAISIVLALWAASAGMQKLLTAVNSVYDEEETRGFLRLRGLALLLTLGAVVFFALTIGLIAFLPSALEQTNLGGVAQTLLNLLRWPLLLGAFILGIAVVFRYGPDRDEPRWRWVSWGAVVAGILWIVASVGFGIYTRYFGSFNETYGSLAAVILLMLWLFLTAFVVLFAAELDAELEHQTLRDTTTGEPQPMGARGAAKADTLPSRGAG